MATSDIAEKVIAANPIREGSIILHVDKIGNIDVKVPGTLNPGTSEVVWASGFGYTSRWDDPTFYSS